MLIIVQCQETINNRDIFSICFNKKVCCMFSLELPHQDGSNENTQQTIFNIKKKVTLSYPKSAAMGFFSKGLRKSSKYPW